MSPTRTTSTTIASRPSAAVRRGRRLCGSVIAERFHRREATGLEGRVEGEKKAAHPGQKHSPAKARRADVQRHADRFEDEPGKDHPERESHQRAQDG